MTGEHEYQFKGIVPLKYVGVFSGGASSLRALRQSSLYGYGKKIRMVGAFTNKPEMEAATGYAVARSCDVDPIFFDPSKYDTPGEFWRAVTPVIERMNPDVICLSGFMKRHSIIKPPFLDVFRNRILNVHPADLAIVADLHGMNPFKAGIEAVRKARSDVASEPADIRLREKKLRPIYTGDDAVSMAVFFGEEFVCSTIHSVTRKLDRGPIVVQSKRYPVERRDFDRWLDRYALDEIVGHAKSLQEWTKTHCDGPAFCRAMELMLGGMTIGDYYVALNGKRLPFGGYQMEEEPVGS